MKKHTLLACTVASLASLNSWAATPDAPATAVATAPTGLPLWEAGLAAGAGYVPDYPGADRYRTRAAVLPVFIYRGPVLRIDGGSVSGRLARSSDWELDLSANGAFNANNNALRQGMPDLDYLFGVGPQAIYKGLKTWPGKPTLHLKLRAILSTDFSRVDSRGISFDPQLRWRLPQVAGTPATLSLSLQPSWASRSLQSYFYQVNPSEATASRPAYNARAGYMGTEVGMTLSHRPQRDVSWFVTARLLSLHGAANTASPLLRDKSNFSVGAGVVWTPWRSDRRAVE
jgi:outer membrane scaffolding protein for murein synthesis (MipA/OmpV family)